MKKIIISAVFGWFFIFFAFGNDISLDNTILTFELPQLPQGTKRTEPFTIIKTEDKGRVGVVIKFPGINSLKYNMIMTANMSIQMEKVNPNTSTEDFFLYYLKIMTGNKGNYGNTDDDIIECKLPGKFGGLVKTDNGKVKTYAYVLGSVHNNVGILVIFEVSDDLYVFCRPIFKEILESMTISDKKN